MWPNSRWFLIWVFLRVSGSSSKVREKRKKPVEGKSTKKKGCHYVSEESDEEIKNKKTNSIFVKRRENRYKPIVTESALPSDSRGKADVKGRAKVKCSKEPVNTIALVKDESKPVPTKQNPPQMDVQKEKEISLIDTESGSSHVNVLSKSDNGTTAAASQFVLDDLFDSPDQKRKSAPKKVKKSTDLIEDLDFNQKNSTKNLSKTGSETSNFKQKKKIATNILDILNL